MQRIILLTLVGAGEHGEVVAEGTAEEIMKVPNSLRVPTKWSNKDTCAKDKKEANRIFNH